MTPSAPPPPGAGNLALVQVLRGVAAVAVVAHHAIRATTVKAEGEITPPALLNYPYLYDALAFGVDLFFVISGFIMVYVSTPYISGKQPISGFILKRVARIYPLYIIVLALLLMIIFIQSFLSNTNNFDLSYWRIISSALLIPSYNSDGFVQPILGVGWTLSYEIYFYIIFAVSITVFRGRFLPALSIGIALICLLASFSGLANNAAIDFLANPIALEFVMGCWVGHAVKRGLTTTIPIITSATSVIIIFAAPALLNNEELRVIYWGVPCAAITLSFVSINLNNFKLKPYRWLLLIGNASYSIYLIHILIIGIIGSRLAVNADRIFSSSYATTLAVFITIILSIAGGMILHLLVEKPIGERLTSWIKSYERRHLAMAHSK
ncbi:acyltransferase family protein [Pseudomonas sp. ODNR1LW]|nr:acyltransferase family protein [Pseudomonas sp. ODNR1LW]